MTKSIRFGLLSIGLIFIGYSSCADVARVDHKPVSFSSGVTDEYTHIYRGALIVERVRHFAEDTSQKEMINWGAGPSKAPRKDPSTIKSKGGTTGIFSAVKPKDLKLYRKHLPQHLAMPKEPSVAFVTVFYNRLNPVTDYHEAMVMLKGICYDGSETWAVMSMPVESRLMMDMGVAWGFPKFISDKISVSKTEAVTTDGGEIQMKLSFSPGQWSEADRAMEPEGGCWGINNMAVIHPVSTGECPMAFAYGPISVQERVEGTVKIYVHKDDWWAGLIDDGVETPGVWQRYVGAGDSVIRKIGK